METLYRQKGEQNRFLSETSKAHQVLDKGRRGERKKSRHSSRVTMESNNNRTFFAQTKFIVRVPARPECFMGGADLLFIQVHSIFFFCTAEREPDFCGCLCRLFMRTCANDLHSFCCSCHLLWENSNAGAPWRPGNRRQDARLYGNPSEFRKSCSLK